MAIKVKAGGRTFNFPDGTPEDAIYAEIAKVTAESAPQAEAPLTRERPAAGTPTAQQRMDYENLNPKQREFAPSPDGPDAMGQWLKNPDNLPTVGGFVGGLMGTAIPIPGVGTAAGTVIGSSIGAGLGGMFGVGAREGVKAATQPDYKFPAASQIGKDMAYEGAVQGGSQLLGGAVTKGAGVVGRGLLNRALQPGAKLANEFPNLAETAIKANVNPATNKGLAAVEKLRGLSATAADDIINAASPDAPLIRPGEIMGAFRPAVTAAKQQIQAAVPEGPGVFQGVLDRARETKASFGGTPAVAPIPAGPDRVVTIPRTGWTPPSSGDDAVMAAEAQLGHRANFIPSSVFRPTEAEVRAARELGSTATTIPRSVLNPPTQPASPLQFVTPGTPAVPGVSAIEGGVNLRTAQNTLKVLQNRASSAYKSQAAGNPINDVDAELDMGLAGKWGDAIKTRAPQVADQNKWTQDLIGLARAGYARQGAQGLPTYALPAIVGAATGVGSNQIGGADPAKAAGLGAVMAATTTPQGLGRLGLTLGRAGLNNGQIPANVLRMLASMTRGNGEPEYVPPPRPGQR
jgi:hypothetical protein